MLAIWAGVSTNRLKWLTTAFNCCSRLFLCLKHQTAERNKMTLDIFMEIFGYIGTAVVIISMLMTSVTKLRVINICGGVISLIYAVYCNTWPVVLLNGTLVSINIVQLIRLRLQKFKFNYVKTDANDKNLAYFRFLYSDDIIKVFPDYNFHVDEGSEAHLIYFDSEIVAMLIGKRRGDTLDIDIDYVAPKYRDMSVSGYMYKRLAGAGIKELCAPFASEYLAKRGYTGEEGMIMNLEKSENK